MFYLADEMFSQRNKTVTIHIGKPIPYEELNDSRSDQEWADRIKDIVYAMA